MFAYIFNLLCIVAKNIHTGFALIFDAHAMTTELHRNLSNFAGFLRTITIGPEILDRNLMESERITISCKRYNCINNYSFLPYL